MVDLPEDEKEERVERARIARKEARETINEQTETLSDIDGKAIRIFRINLIVTSILIAGLSIAVSSDQTSYDTFITIYTTFALFLMFLSMILAAMTYTSTSSRIGIAKNTIRDSILNQDYDLDLVEEEIAYSYGDMIRYNYKRNASNALLFTLTLLTTVGSILYLVIGLVDIYNSIHISINGVAFVLLLIVIKFSGLYGMTRRWFELTDPHGRLADWILNSFKKFDIASDQDS